MSSSQLRGPVASIATLLQMRARTDVEIPIKWLLLSLGNYLLWAVVAIALWSSEAGVIVDLTVLFSGLAIAGLGLSSGTAYLVFKLLNRMNEHSTRSRSMLWAAIDTLRKEVGDSDQQSLLLLNTTEVGFRNLAASEKDRGAILWALLSIIPFVGWFFLAVSQWRLSRDLARHDRMESLVLEDVDRTLRNRGRSIPLTTKMGINPRDILGVSMLAISVLELLSGIILGLTGALVLVYLTIGAFSLFWIDLSVKGPTQHFYYHSKLEPEIARLFPEYSTVQGGIA